MSETSLRDRLLLSTLKDDEKENGRRLLRALSLIEGKLKDVEKVLEERAHSAVPTISLIADYLVEGGGKRIRPALLLLCARLLGYEGRRDVLYGAVVEYIHTATLVHDDVIDAAETRRGRASVNSRWGNELTVLFGDYLYMKAMEIALDEGDLGVLKLLSDVTLGMTEGEILGSEKRGRLDIELSTYLEIIHRKTALLFGAACKIPSFLVTVDPSIQQALWNFGVALGKAFQIQDDLLDFTASERDLGKPVLSDLREGKLTLPLLLAMPSLSRAERKLLERVVADAGFVSVSSTDVLELVTRHGGLEKARDMLDRYAEEARGWAMALPEHEARNALILASEYAARRRK
ncbi:MAG: Octaprenyl diphosphate synthase [Thermoanaerobaculia bacterium]|nr:Octaprenyl diphosphate synthase [Thermoanaerobaculia bacterium]